MLIWNQATVAADINFKVLLSTLGLVPRLFR